MEAIIIFTYIISILAGLILLTLFFYQSIRRVLIRRSELKEGSEFLAQKEAHPTRDLMPEEKVKLNSMVKSASSFSPLYFLVTTTFFLIFVYLQLDSDPRFHTTAQKYPFIPFLILLVSTLFTFLFFYQNREKAKKMKQDLISQVFEVKGKVYKEHWRGKYINDLIIYVRGIKFDGQQKLNTGIKLFDSVDQDQAATVEYSPNSKKIWQLKKDN